MKLEQLYKVLKDGELPAWLVESFTERQQGLVRNCLGYAIDGPSGLPGHQLILLVAKMATILTEQEYVLASLPDPLEETWSRSEEES